MRAVVTILGSGTSTGIPVIGCRCPTCTSTDRRNQRLRSSIMLARVDDGERLVIDTGPDFRAQMLRENVQKLEHVLYTHAHADHSHGFDDLRAFYFHHRAPVTCHVHELHVPDFRSRFSYAFEDTGYIGTKPQVTLAPFGSAPFQVIGLTIEPALLPHGHTQSAGFKIGRFAYVTDFKALPPDVLSRWRGGIDVMVASGIHFGRHATHSAIDETAAMFGALGVRRGIITHIAHEVEHVSGSAKLPNGVELATDGLSLEVGI